MRKPKKQPKLPSKPSKLIRLALKDLIAAEKDKAYNIRMCVWHEPQPQPLAGLFLSQRCNVCFAGSVMAKTLKISDSVTAEPSAFDRDSHDKLLALEHFRIGSVDDAFRSLALPFNENLGDPYIGSVAMPDYHDSPRKFKASMGRLADDLERLGY